MSSLMIGAVVLLYAVVILMLLGSVVAGLRASEGR